MNIENKKLSSKKNTGESIETHTYSENEINHAIKTVEGLELADGPKKIILYSLQTVISINALILKNKFLAKMIGKFFGFKSEKSVKPRSVNPGDKGNNGQGGRSGRKSSNSVATEDILHKHPSLLPKDPCPEEECCGTVYELKNPGIYLRVTANQPLNVIRHLVQKLRCNLCDKIFEHVPDFIKESDKYDDSVRVSVVIDKCFYGIPHQRDLKSALSSTKKFELFAEMDDLFRPLYDQLLYDLVNSGHLSFDDTKYRIQSGKKGASTNGWASVFMSTDVVIVSIGKDHAGKKLELFMRLRDKEQEKPTLMSDALPAYESYKQEIGTDAHCLVHGRRRFMDAKNDAPDFVDPVIELIKEIYRINGEDCLGLSDEERLAVHKNKSLPIMEQIKKIAKDGIDSNSFLPNSELGKCLNYWLRCYENLTVFTRIAGTPLDTNHVERKIKTPIRLRKSAPLFGSEESAQRHGRMTSVTETALLHDCDLARYMLWAAAGLRAKTPPKKLTPWIFKKLHETSEALN